MWSNLINKVSEDGNIDVMVTRVWSHAISPLGPHVRKRNRAVETEAACNTTPEGREEALRPCCERTADALS